MAHDVTSISESDLGSLSVNDLLPERPAIIGEFSAAYEEFKNATIADLAPATRYEFILTLQLVDLNWAILQLKPSADVSLAVGTERGMKHQLSKKLESDGDKEYERLLEIYVAEGGDEDEFEDPVDWDAIDENIKRIVTGLKSKDPSERESAAADARAHDVDPRMVLGLQFLNNTTYKRQTEQLADLEKRLRLLSGEYREIQKSRPIDVVSVSGVEELARSSTGPITAEGKAISAQNARKHGLNVHPDGELVNLWYNLILNNGADASEEPIVTDPRREVALKLAIAEARYHRAQRKADTHEMELHSAQQRVMNLHEEIWNVFDRMPKRIKDGPADPYDLAYVNFAVKELEQMLTQISRERRLYKRYLGEARAQRANTPRDWCAINRN